MKKYLHISNRQSGKTSKAVYEFLKDPDDTLFISHNYNSARFLFERLNLDSKYRKNFLCEESMTKTKSHEYKKVIMDEYFFFDLKFRKILPSIIYPLGIEEVYAFSTPYCLYDKNMLEFVKEQKKLGNQYSDEIINVYLESNKDAIGNIEEMTKELEDLYYNILTDPDVKLIINDHFLNRDVINRSKEIYGGDPIGMENTIDTEVYGKYIK